MKSVGGSPARRTESKRFASFVVTSGIAAAVNLTVRWLLSHVMLFELAITLAWLVGMTTAFLLAKRFVFASGERGWPREYGRFAAVNAVSLLIVLGVSAGLARIIFPAVGLRWHAHDLAHLVGVVSPILLSYYAHKHYSFAWQDTRP